MKGRIVVADDEALMRRLVLDVLRRDGYDVLEAENGERAVDLVRSTGGVALVILDIMMPVMDGITACQEIREFSTVPILMLTARSEEEDELSGFQYGADDYITKPFSLPVLMARVHALLRRSGEAETLSAGGLTVDTRSHNVQAGGETVELTLREFELLYYLLKNRNIALSREQILNSVWSVDFLGDARTVDTHMKNIRQKLGDAADCIKTIRGYGYKLEG